MNFDDEIAALYRAKGNVPASELMTPEERRRFAEWMSSVNHTGEPPATGLYLVCEFEWVGVAADKPKAPRWTVRRFEKGKTRWEKTPPPHPFVREVTGRIVQEPGHWVRTQYRCDTGGMENLEVVCWRPLPPLPA